MTVFKSWFSPSTVGSRDVTDVIRLTSQVLSCTGPGGQPLTHLPASRSELGCTGSLQCASPSFFPHPSPCLYCEVCGRWSALFGLAVCLLHAVVSKVGEQERK